MIVEGTGSPGGTATVRVCLSDRGSRRWSGMTMSNQTTPTPEPGTVVAGAVGLAISVIEAVSSGPPSVVIDRCRSTSRTPTDVTLTGTGKPLVRVSS